MLPWNLNTTLFDVRQPLLDSIIADLDVAFVLEISYAFRTRTPDIATEFGSPKELEIIEHPDSCYVLGRSGTGYVFLSIII
jgi:hypothetical protein